MFYTLSYRRCLFCFLCHLTRRKQELQFSNKDFRFRITAKLKTTLTLISLYTNLIRVGTESNQTLKFLLLVRIIITENHLNRLNWTGKLIITKNVCVYMLYMVAYTTCTFTFRTFYILNYSQNCSVLKFILLPSTRKVNETWWIWIKDSQLLHNRCPQDYIGSGWTCVITVIA